MPTQQKNNVRLDASWMQVLGSEFEKPYMAELRAWLLQRREQGKVIFPPADEWLAALNRTPFGRVRVVIIGQDPYHGPGQAHGLCFSVAPGVRVPPSLQNIYKELQSDLGIAPPGHGYLGSWSDQGVLLLNAVLTVEQGDAGSHQGRGWETFTDAVIAALNAERENLVFLLWGAYAQRKGKMIDRDRHCVLEAPHPSPLSAHRGFLGCRHFSAANRALARAGVEPIDWQLPETPSYQGVQSI